MEASAEQGTLLVQAQAWAASKELAMVLEQLRPSQRRQMLEQSAKLPRLPSADVAQALVLQHWDLAGDPADEVGAVA